MRYEQTFLLALFFTIIIETAVLFFLVRKIYKIQKSGLSTSLLLSAGFFASFATLPYLWFIWPSFISQRTLFVLSGEMAVFLIEAIFYYFVLKLSFKRALIISFVCNLISYLLGLIII